MSPFDALSEADIVTGWHGALVEVAEFLFHRLPSRAVHVLVRGVLRGVTTSWRGLNPSGGCRVGDAFVVALALALAFA